MDQPNRFRFSAIAVCVVLIAVAIFLVFYHDKNQDVALVLGGIAGYIWFSKQERIMKAEAKKLYLAFLHSPTGRNRVPQWHNLIDLQIERYKDYFFYGYYYEGATWGLCLNANYTEESSMLEDMFNLSINQLAFSDWRKLITDKIFGKTENMNLSKAIDMVRKAGGRISWPRGETTRPGDKYEIDVST